MWRACHLSKTCSDAYFAKCITISGCRLHKFWKVGESHLLQSQSHVIFASWSLFAVKPGQVTVHLLCSLHSSVYLSGYANNRIIHNFLLFVDRLGQFAFLGSTLMSWRTLHLGLMKIPMLLSFSKPGLGGFLTGWQIRTTWEPIRWN